MSVAILLGSLLLPACSERLDQESSEKQDFDRQNTRVAAVGSERKIATMVAAKQGRMFITKGIKWYAFDKGIAQAKRDRKFTFVKFYADWCGYCNKMQRETLSDSNVQALLRKSFVSVLIDGESGKILEADGQRISERELAQAFGVRGFPLLAFMDPDGDIITKIPGYVDADEFRRMLSYIATSSYKETEYTDFKENY